MHGDDAGIEPLLLCSRQRLLAGADMPGLLDEGLQLLALLGDVLRQRMLRRDRHEGGAEDGVVARGEDLQRGQFLGQLQPLQREFHGEAGGAADPVGLHHADLLRPLVERRERFEQVVGILGDLEEPLRQVALLDQGARAPAAAIDHLLIGQHCMLDRIPVDLRQLSIGHSLLQEIQEQTLLVYVVAGIAGGELATPVDRQTHGLELALHDLDVLGRPFGWMHAPLQGGVLGRQAECVPAHRVQDIEPLRPHVAGHHVAQRVVARMADMDAPRRIGEHLELVALGRLALVLGAEGAALVPHLLPVLLAHGRVIAFACHGLASLGVGRRPG